MTAASAIIVGESWISEHYFTTDATGQSFRAKVLERRKAWDAEDQQGLTTPRSRFTAGRAHLESGYARLREVVEAESQSDAGARAELIADLHGQVVDILGLRRHGLRVSGDNALLRVAAPGITEHAPLAVVLGEPVDNVEALLAKDAATLHDSVVLEDGAEYTSSARLVSALYVEDQPPDLVLVLAGRWAMLTERERWAEGRYLAIDLLLVCERNDAKRGGEIDRALTCLSAESIAPDGDGALWWHAVLEESVKHTVGVSKDLRDGVRLSIELIANEVVSRRTAKGLPPLPAGDAQPLARQALRFLYRILFLLYAEASPQLGVVPVGAQEYDQGYSLDRLRELVQVPLSSPQAHYGTHLYDSLGVLFRLVGTGHRTAAPPTDDVEDGSAFDEGLSFHPLRADLFEPRATAHIDHVGLGNAALQRVLGHLLLSKERRGRDRGFISYAELGINQLGAVYEGLMSYTGFFAETDLYEVAPAGDPTKGSWVVPVDRAEGIDQKDFVRVADEITGEARPELHPQGSFVFRLAGRERQQSASYYTPEVLTRFTVGQALEELLDQDGHTTTAEEILGLTVCEPALGSGAFAIEAVRQLAEQYLTRRQDELGRRIDPDDYPRELQTAKAYLALHNVYGVDLNATAVELAEISLWLDTMVEGLSAPWFGLHLRRGNSLIGARRAVYRRRQVTDKSWLKEVPRDLPLSSLAADLASGAVGSGLDGGLHHFLLPADGWGAAADAKEAPNLVPDAAKALKQWRTASRAKPTRKQLDDLTELAHRVEVLWQYAYRRLSIAETEIRRSIPVWESGDQLVGGDVQREAIEAALADSNGAYRRLRRVMDAWCALWFWPLTATATTIESADGQVRVTPPDLACWIAGLQALLGRSPEVRKPSLRGHLTLTPATGWDDLGAAERLELEMSGAQPIHTVLREHPWLQVCERVAERQGFFHWELDFAAVFARGGFDLQVGNPPWVRPRSDVDALLAEGDPWWQLTVKPSQTLIATRRAETLQLPGIADIVVDGTAEVAATAAFFGSTPQFPQLAGLQPDTYRCFMVAMWGRASRTGLSAMVHLESHLTDEKAGPLRSELYLRLRRHWHFVNELQLFEIQHQKQYGVAVYGSPRRDPEFLQSSWLYHPDTVIRSLAHDGSGAEPGQKDSNGDWDLRPHASRIVRATRHTLTTWHALLEAPNVPLLQTRMVFAVNRSVAVVLDKLARAPRIGELDLQFSRGWDESIDRKKGFFESEWGQPDSWADVILQGPHLFVGTPMYKSPNKTMLHHLDWSATDFETLEPDAIPITAYKPAGNRSSYDAAYTHWDDQGTSRSARDYYRVAWRAMAANTGERTLISSLIPPGAAHINGVFCVGGLSAVQLVELVASVSSLVLDFAVRVAPKSGIYQGVLARLPLSKSCALRPELTLRVLRLNTVTDAYAALWADCFSSDFLTDSWTRAPHDHAEPLAAVAKDWNSSTPLRLASERRQALVEIDALVALALGLTADELCTIYRTQFAVLYGYDRHTYFYDVNGRLVPNSVLTTWRKKSDAISESERSATNQAGNTYTYELPFGTLDREADMRRAYAEFERRIAERT